MNVEIIPISPNVYRQAFTDRTRADIYAQQRKTWALYGAITGWRFRDEKSFALDSYPDPNIPPTSMAELRVRLLQFFPCYSAQPTAVMDETGIPHFYLTSHGAKPEGELPPSHQILFSEQEAVIAYWFHFTTKIMEIEFERDMAIHGIYWREWPELGTWRGNWRVISRQSFVTRKCDLPNAKMPPIIMRDGKWAVAQ